MIEKNRVLVVVPARGGSKGIPLKNLRQVGGISLLARVGQLVRKLSWVDRAIVSTDNQEIAAAARTVGLATPFRRPDKLSGDHIGDWDVLYHSLKEVEAIDEVRYDVIVMLQPTSPQRTADQVEAVVRKLLIGNYDTVWTVSPSDLKMHPLKQLIVEDKGMRLYDREGEQIVARQQLTPLYHRNGIAYAFSRTCLTDQKSIYGHDMGAVIIEEPVINIDTEDDIHLAEKFLGN